MSTTIGPRCGGTRRGTKDEGEGGEKTSGKEDRARANTTEREQTIEAFSLTRDVRVSNAREILGWSFAGSNAMARDSSLEKARGALTLPSIRTVYLDTWEY